MANDIPLDKLLGITKEPVETMSHSDMLRNNLMAPLQLYDHFYQSTSE